MNKVLFEVGYNDSLLGIITSFLNFGILFFLLFALYILFKEKKGAITKMIAVFGIIIAMFAIKGWIEKYEDIIIAYRSGDYLEVAGKVENYYHLRGEYESFTVEGVNFECSGGILEGYHKQGNNRIIVEGRHLRIRYIAGRRWNTIVYIEQMMPDEWETTD